MADAVKGAGSRMPVPFGSALRRRMMRVNGEAD